MFKRISEWIFIDYVEDEHDDSRNYVPSFWFRNKRHYLDDYAKTHSNPWLSGEFPEHIHGMEMYEHYHPLFIELSRNGEQVRVYEEV